VTKEQAIRFPVLLTLLTAALALGVSMLMQEPPRKGVREGESSFMSDIFRAATWILKTPIVLALISAALIHDSFVRLFMTMNSEYYRLIGLPEAAFGVIGAAFAALGLITPSLAQWMVNRGRLERNYLVISALVLLGLLGVAQAWPFYGVLVVAVLGIAFGLLNFFTSHYLNAAAASAQRATVLSFKGLALNLGFGFVSLLYAALLRSLRLAAPAVAAEGAQEKVFAASLPWLPAGFLVLLAPLVVFYLLLLRRGASRAPRA
jgi:hypothetical protein